MKINDLTPDTTYLFKVQAVGPDGNAGSYSVEHEFHTLPLGTNKLQSPKTYINISSKCFIWQSETDKCSRH